MFTLHTDSGSVNVSFDVVVTNSRRLGGYGWELNFDCAIDATPAFVTRGIDDAPVPGCPAPGVNRTIRSDKGGVVITDTDGIGPVKLFGGPCSWTFRCTGALATTAWLHITFNKITGDSLTVTSGTPGEGPIAVYEDVNGAFTVPSPFATFVLRARNEPPGATIRFECHAPAPGALTIGCPSDRVVTAANGTIMSDVDGAGPISYGDPTVAVVCQWTIRCPPLVGNSSEEGPPTTNGSQESATVVVVESVDGSFPRNQFGGMLDWLYIDDMTFRDSGVTLPSSLRPLRFSNNGTVVVRFHRVGISDQDFGHVPKPAGAPFGFTLQYRCVPKPGLSIWENEWPVLGCPAPDSSSRNAVVGSIYGGRIATDPDGSAAVTVFYAPSLSCGWNISCPAGSWINFTLLSRSLSEFGTLWLHATALPGDAIPLHLDGTAARGSIFPYAAASVLQQFTRHAPPTYVLGAEFRYECVPPTVVEREPMVFVGCPPQTPQGSSGPVVITVIGKGVIKTDIDGDGPMVYVPPGPLALACHWSIECPPRTAGIAAIVTGELATTQYQNNYDNLIVNNITWFAKGGGPLVEWPPRFSFPLARRLEVDLTIPILSGVEKRVPGYKGLSLAFECLPPLRVPDFAGALSLVTPPIFGCPATPFVTRALNGTIVTDTDGVGAFPLMSASPCRYRIICPTRMHIVLRSVLLAKTTVAVSWSTTQLTGSSYSNVTIDANTVDLSITPPQASGGATIDYQCVAPRTFPAVVAGLCDGEIHAVTAPVGMLISDLDGGGPILFDTAVARVCRWRIDCPKDRPELRLTSVQGDLGVSDDIYREPTDTLTIGVVSQKGRKLQLSTFAAQASLSQSPTVTFEVGLGPLNSHRRSGNVGFTVAYMCSTAADVNTTSDEFSCDESDCSGNGQPAVPSTRPACQCRCDAGWSGERCQHCSPHYVWFPEPCGLRRSVDNTRTPTSRPAKSVTLTLRPLHARPSLSSTIRVVRPVANSTPASQVWTTAHGTAPPIRSAATS